MPLRPLTALALLSLACVAGGDEPPSVVGLSPQQAAEVSTEVACAYAERCGQLSITCADCEGECGGCEVEVIEVAYEACDAELAPQLATGFACAALTPGEEQAVDACLQALGGWACPSVEAATQWTNGGSGEDPTALPAGCDVLEDVRFRCLEHGADGRQGAPAPG